MRNWLVVAVLLNAIGIPSPALAIRAPYHFMNRGAGELYPLESGLKLLSEQIQFHAESRYEGVESIWKPRKITVRSKYIIYSDRDSRHAFKLVLADPVIPEVHSYSARKNGSWQVNDFSMQIFRDKRLQIGLSDVDLTACEIRFDLQMKKGVNDLSIAYSQPLNYQELEYGTFKKSTFRTMFPYELDPLRKWELDESFILDLSFSICDDRLRSKYLGSDYFITIWGHDSPGYDDAGKLNRNAERKALPIQFNKKPEQGNIRSSIKFKRDFPGYIQISY